MFPKSKELGCFVWRFVLINLKGNHVKGTKEPLDEGERGELKSWLKAQHSKNEDHGIITSLQLDGETMEAVGYFILGVPKSL